MGAVSSTALPDGRAVEIAANKKKQRDLRRQQEEIRVSKLGRACRNGDELSYTTTTGAKFEFDYGVPNFNGASDVSKCLSVPHGTLYRMVRVNNSCTATETEEVSRRNEMSAINAARIRGAVSRGEDPTQASRRMDEDDAISTFSDPEAAALARATVTRRAQRQQQRVATTGTSEGPRSNRQVRIAEPQAPEGTRTPGLTACHTQPHLETDGQLTWFDDAALQNDAYWVSSTQRDRRPLLCADSHTERVVPLYAGEGDGGNVRTSVTNSKKRKLQKVLTFKERHTWAFFNDSFDQSFVVTCFFHSDSRLKALSDTVLLENADVEAVGEQRGTTKMWAAHLAILPLETKMFVEGKIYGGYRILTDVFVQPVPSFAPTAGPTPPPPFTSSTTTLPPVALTPTALAAPAPAPAPAPATVHSPVPLPACAAVPAATPAPAPGPTTAPVVPHKPSTPILPAVRRRQQQPPPTSFSNSSDADDTGADVPAAVTRRRVLSPRALEEEEEEGQPASLIPLSQPAHLNRGTAFRAVDDELATPPTQTKVGGGKQFETEHSLSQGTTTKGGLSVSGSSGQLPEEAPIDSAGPSRLGDGNSPVHLNRQQRQQQQPQPPPYSGSTSLHQSALFCIIANHPSGGSLLLNSDQASMSVTAE